MTRVSARRRARGAGLGLALMLAVAPAIAAPPLPPPSPYERPQRLVRLPDGRRLNLYCTGRGSPTIILESGWKADSAGWARVQPRLAALTTTCSYDRAGMGFSDPGPMPRSAAAIADDLAALIRAARLPGPYLVVAHSLGGLPARLLADKPENHVAGLLLVDPSVEYQARRMESAAPGTERAMTGMVLRAEASANTPILPPQPGAKPLTPAQARRATTDYRRTLASELSSLSGISSDQVAQSRHSYGAMPLVVLTAGKSAIGPAGQRWVALHEEVARLSTIGEQRVVPGSGHLIQIEQPEAVAAAARELVARIRRGS